MLQQSSRMLVRALRAGLQLSGILLIRSFRVRKVEVHAVEDQQRERTYYAVFGPKVEVPISRKPT
jgi:hypothetical protein